MQPRHRSNYGGLHAKPESKAPDAIAPWGTPMGSDGGQVGQGPDGTAKVRKGHKVRSVSTVRPQHAFLGAKHGDKRQKPCG